MSDSTAKHTLKLQAIPMQELRVLLENDLRRQGYASFLTNMTESDLALKVARASEKPTLVALTRHRHRPLEVELQVDHKMLNSHDLITKRAKSSSRGGRRSSFMMYRWMWIGLILFWFAIAIFQLFIGIILSLVYAFTPGWSDIQRSAGILALSGGILIWYVYIRPRVKAIDTRKRNQSDLYLLENIKSFIEGIAYQAPTSSIVRCWNCFEIIDQLENFCANCGKQQN